jgi:hypothetical protein
MRQLLVVGLVLVLACTLAAPALATRDVNPVQIVNPEPTLYDPLAVVPGPCTVGNPNPAYWAIGDFLYPPEEYKLVFDPVDGCGACPFGYQITSVHVLLQSSSACTIIMSVDLEDAIFPDGPACPKPGPEDCLGGPYQVNLPGAGLWNINLPITCGCAFLDYTYLLSVHFQSLSCTDGTVPDLVTDNFPTVCTSWNNYGTGWTDIVRSFGFPGNLMMWADAQCCEPPVGTGTKSWGAIKGLFRK